MRWLREQADMALVAEDAVRLALEFLVTKDGQKAVKEAKAVLKVRSQLLVGLCIVCGGGGREGGSVLCSDSMVAGRGFNRKALTV